MKLMETQLPEMYSTTLYQDKCFDLAPEYTDMIFDTLFTGVANLLNQTKTMDKPVAYVFETVDKRFVAASVVQYFENSDEKNPGNWSLVWTFNEEDIPENALRISINDAQSHSYIKTAAIDKHNFKYDDIDSLVTCNVSALELLKKWLDENAKENTEVMIELDGVFQARVAVENGEKVFAIEPAGEIKNLIKDDAAIEK